VTNFPSLKSSPERTFLVRTEGLEDISQTSNSLPKKGLVFAGTILFLWLVSFLSLLSVHISSMNVVLVGLAMAWQMMLYTGLFITAHDAMHGSVFPDNLKINHTIGTLAVTAYGLFSYQELLRKHWLHHRYPGTEMDPDFHEGNTDNFFIWYFQFMKHYWNWGRILALVVLSWGINVLFHVPALNLLLFWGIPSILSSLQLFYFGTFLTHREPAGGHTNPHRTQSTHFPVLWSLITCYHFGYHQEHHEYPNIPWWQLHRVYRLRH